MRLDSKVDSTIKKHTQWRKRMEHLSCDFSTFFPIVKTLIPSTVACFPISMLITLLLFHADYTKMLTINSYLET